MGTRVRLKLSTKILIYFLLVSLIPLIVTNFLLVSYANSQLLNAASTKQQAIATYLSENVSSYLDNNSKKLNNLAQLYSTGNIDSGELDLNMAVLFSQDSDLQRLAVIDNSGYEQAVFDQDGRVEELKNSSDSDAFRAVNFLDGRPYVSSVSYNENNEPVITIAVPVLKSSFNENLDNLEGADFGSYSSPDDIQGAIVANYDIKNLWQTVLSTRVGEGGYAYVVDGLGNLVAHPDSKFLEGTKKLTNVDAVKQLISNDLETRKTESETGLQVISTPQIIKDSGWAVIVEEPVSSIYASVNSYIKLATTVGLTAIVLSIALSIYFRKQLTGPIKKLAQGAKKIGSGQFGHTIDINTNDELQSLAETFNSMGANIQKLVTDMKNNNITLETEKTKLTNIIGSVTDGIIALDKSGRILSINPPAAALAGKNESELVGKSLPDVYAWQQFDAPFSLDIKNPGVFEYNDLSLQTGIQLSFLDIVVSISGRENSDVVAIVTVHDLTKSRELDFMKLDFVAIAAHELRTPLTVIQGYLDLINTDAVNQLSIYNIENLQKMVRSTNELRDLINKLLNIARIERGEMEIFIEKIDLAKHIKENVHYHQSVAVQKNQKLTYTLDTDSAVNVPADPSSITEVLNNLIGNALKFTDYDGEVTVSLNVNNKEVRVEVKDNGPGVPNELQDKLFSKFYRAERSLISGTRGTGLGLFISRTIIELQHGQIGLEPFTGDGSTFYFTLPIYNPEIHDKLVMKRKMTGGVHGWFKKNTSS